MAVRMRAAFGGLDWEEATADVDSAAKYLEQIMGKVHTVVGGASPSDRAASHSVS